MRPLTKSETRLLRIFLAVALLLVNVVLLPALWRYQQRLERDAERLRADTMAVHSWLAEKSMWTARRQWLDLKQPRLSNSGEANSSLLESLQKTARTHQINIIDQSFLEGTTQPSYQEVGVKLKVSGSLEMIIRWLTEIQQPELFQAIQRISLRSGAEPSVVVCELQVTRWYAPKITSN
jgi:hypothetical protein